MEAVKLGRRRIHDPDCDGYRQMKRRIVNEVCNVDEEDGDNAWRLSTMIPDKSRAQLPPVKLDMLFSTRDNIVDVSGRASGPESLPVLSEKQAILPPSLRESERMQFVERWINSIPLDAPLWAQTSLNRVVPLADPKCFPDELSISDTQPTTGSNSRGYDYYQSNLQSDPCTQGQTGSRSSPQQYPSMQVYVSPGANATRNGQSGNNNMNFTTSVGLLGPRHPSRPTASPCGIGESHQRCSRISHTNNQGVNKLDKIDNSIPHISDHFQDNRPNATLGVSSRFFDDMETKVLVKLFGDYFANGSCPSLNEVRHRIANSVLQIRRNETSIRAKVKRLQMNGRWTDYAML